eukprot:gnl/MRDRNA2_/MRDRNA2_116741_c0_seq1.p1 gnl/MRDRNA2_/MRDRNA2_116741_c0~~gnl/MRDRNA2_/MRDRNA2_116741_c0_seq1.p1  ORF type:complete len:571 (+),score=95.10 gnl/MRDRNA2_/MRDRNA2_116741_c0_seq1:113-1825(+)
MVAEENITNKIKMIEPCSKRLRTFRNAIGDLSLEPYNPLVSSLLTDMYQLSMTYAQWKNNRHHYTCVFELFFRKCPFQGEYVIFAGLEEALRHIASFHFTDQQIDILRNIPACRSWDEAFFDFLRNLDCKDVTVYAQQEGSMVFPKVPLLRVEGPLGVCQLLETTLLNLVNFPSLVATNAARHRIAVGHKKKLLEFGLRRAQGPDGAMSATRYSIVGGFDATSNVQAGCRWDIEIGGTHAHSFVTSFVDLKCLGEHRQDPLVKSAIDKRRRLQRLFNCGQSNEGELAAFVAYAKAYPDSFVALVDSYDTLKSGLINFLAVAIALHESGKKAVGVRLDSGDLAWLSIEVRKMFRRAAEEFGIPFLKDLQIVASNDINEEVLYALKAQGHEIDQFVIGTNLVTCEKQPALGCVFKLVSIQGQPRIKCSQEIEKMTLPGRKEAYRLYDSLNRPVVDLMTCEGEPMPQPGKLILCRHPFVYSKRMHVNPQRVERLLHKVWDGTCSSPGPLQGEYVNGFPSLQDLKLRCQGALSSVRPDIVRYANPTSYKVAVTQKVFDQMHDLWDREVPTMVVE